MWVRGVSEKCFGVQKFMSRERVHCIHIINQAQDVFGYKIDDFKHVHLEKQTFSYQKKKKRGNRLLLQLN